MNNRALKQAAKVYEALGGDEAQARRMAFLLSGATRLPKMLRDPLQEAAIASLRCETSEAAGSLSPPFPELYRAREEALRALAEAVVAKFTRRVPSQAAAVGDTWNSGGRGTEPDSDAE
jgi:hypothetical protein